MASAISPILNGVAANISIVMAGLDFDTNNFVDPVYIVLKFLKECEEVLDYF